MRKCPATPCCIVLLLTLISGTTFAAPLTEEQQQAFTWFDTLGFPDLHGARWVRVTTGRWSQAADRPPENSYRRAFLLKDEGDRFTVFTPDAQTQTFIRTPADTPEHKQVTYEPRDLVQDVQEYL